MSGDNGLEFNKIAAAVLLAGIIAIVSGLVSEGLYAGGGDHDKKQARGYVIEGAEKSASDGTAAVKEKKPVDIAEFMAKADIAAGKKLIKKCTACHTFDKGGKNGVGPNQWGLMGSNFAHNDGYSYSAAFKALKDRKWTEQEMSEFLASPRKAVPGNKMSFAGIKKPQDRANLIAYLNTLK